VACTPEDKPGCGRLARAGVCAALALAAAAARSSDVPWRPGCRRSNGARSLRCRPDPPPWPRASTPRRRCELWGRLVEGGSQGSRRAAGDRSAPRLPGPGGRFAPGLAAGWGRAGRPGCCPCMVISAIGRLLRVIEPGCWVRSRCAAGQAALEGLAVGLSSGPACVRAPVAPAGLRVSAGLPGRPCADLLARLPQPSGRSRGLCGRALEPSVQRRRQRRLAALPANPLVLVVHGRSGGLIPPSWRVLRRELQSRRFARRCCSRALTQRPCLPDRFPRPLRASPEA